MQYPAQALPIFLDRLADPVTAVIVSIIVVLVFGEPGAIADCSLTLLAARLCRSWALMHRPCVNSCAGEIIPQAFCSAHGLAVGAHAAWFVELLMLVTSPVSWPISKILDWALGSHKTVRIPAAMPVPV